MFAKQLLHGHVYADKTKDIYNLVNLVNDDGSYFFLSRPRRFGKSLLIDTMHELFSGHRELFEGLWIAGSESDYAFTPFPVIRLDMTRMAKDDPALPKSDLIAFIDSIAKLHNIETLFAVSLAISSYPAVFLHDSRFSQSMLIFAAGCTSMFAH